MFANQGFCKVYKELRDMLFRRKDCGKAKGVNPEERLLS
jgi:hypothetical protein